VTKNCIFLDIKKSVFQKHMLNFQSVFEYLFEGMNWLFVLHDVTKITWKIKNEEYFKFLLFSEFKNLEIKTMIFVAAQHLRLDIVYGMYDLRPFLSLTGQKCVKLVL
jgi:hypothetical protein